MSYKIGQKLLKFCGKSIDCRFLLGEELYRKSMSKSASQSLIVKADATIKDAFVPISAGCTTCQPGTNSHDFIYIIQSIFITKAIDII